MSEQEAYEDPMKVSPRNDKTSERNENQSVNKNESFSFCFGKKILQTPKRPGP